MKLIAAGLAVVVLGVGVARADEGMWTLDNLPLAQLKSRYGFTPTAAWIDHVMHASARLALGCSASFVSPDGLVMTNHHCAEGCLTGLSVGGKSYAQDGFKAASRGDEQKCPGMELDQLRSVSDVTAEVNGATDGKTGSDYVKAMRAAQSAIEKSCAGADASHTRCDVVGLYHGGRHALYRYERFEDVRLDFAPDDAIANFGGDPDNFNFPRYDLDVAFLRAYRDGKPARTDFFSVDPSGPKPGEMVITSGNPGSTDRDIAAAELMASRDVQLPAILDYDDTLDGALWQYSRQGAEQSKEAIGAVYGVENSLKVYRGRLESFRQPSLIAGKQAQQAALLDWIDRAPDRRATYGDPFAAIDATIPAERAMYARYAQLEGVRVPLAFNSRLFALARILVRAAGERQKPDADRLPSYRDANLPELEARLFSTEAIHPRLEEMTLALSLTKMRQALGPDDPDVVRALGASSPETLADRLIGGTRLDEPAVRHALWDGGSAAVTSSNDPMIKFALLVDPASRAIRSAWENAVEAPQEKASSAIAKARFARDGTSIYPDATFTERLSFGTVMGWNERGHPVAPLTTFAGLYGRTTGQAPFALNDAWLRAKGRLDLSTPFDIATTNDIIGGNSGSPLIDRDAHVVGLIFDGNIHSLAGNFAYDDTDNRAVAVDSAALLAALRVVYDDGWLADELTAGGRRVTD